MLRGTPRHRLVLPIAATIVAGLSIFGLIRYAAGDPSAPPDPNVTPVPMPVDFVPEPAPVDPASLVTQPPLEVAGVAAPIPKNASIATVIGDGAVGTVPRSENEGLTLGIVRGDSYLYFNEKGLIESKITPGDQADFQATLDALESVARAAN